MSKQSLQLGRAGEGAAADWLTRQGYKILHKNYKTRLGEIDIIARNKDELCFIEVKARSSDRFGIPQEAISAFKQRQICKAALSFLKKNNLWDKKARFDVVSVVYREGVASFELIKNAFELDQNFTY